MANLDDVFKGQFSSCAKIRMFFSFQPMHPSEPLLACDTYTASLVFSWLNTLTFTLSTYISWKIRTDKCAKIHQTRKVKVMRYHDGTNIFDTKRATFIRIDSHDESNNELIKSLVDKMDQF
jgi:hypothetical protein